MAGGFHPGWQFCPIRQNSVSGGSRPVGFITKVKEVSKNRKDNMIIFIFLKCLAGKVYKLLLKVVMGLPW